MNAVNAVQLFILVWTFSAVCQAADDFSVSCKDATGSVGKEVIFNCSVSLQDTECCVRMYMFQYHNGSGICKEGSLVNYCDPSYSFTCIYTPTTAMTAKFKFFLQTKCGREKREFNVNIAVPEEPEIDNTTFGETGNSSFIAEIKNQRASEPFPSSAITAASLSFILIIGLVIMKVVCNKKQNSSTYCGLQRRMFWAFRHDEDNIDRSEDVIRDLV